MIVSFYKKECLRWLSEFFFSSQQKTDNFWWILKRILLKKAGIKVGKEVIIGKGFDCLTVFMENIQFNDYVYIGNDVHLWSFHRIVIGSFTEIGSSVVMTNGSHDTNTFEPQAKPIVIGRGCWIGDGVKIGKGVTIGDYARIEAGSVVIRDIPALVIASGVPAVQVGTRDIPSHVAFGNRFFCREKFVFLDKKL